jgi:chemotaxis protein histidine kinase CheA
MKTKTIRHQGFDEVVPQSGLGRAVLTIGDGEGWDMSAVQRAEAALAAVASEFDAWMDEEVEALGAARRAFGDDPLEANARDRLFRAAHDIRGQAATLGFPVAGRFADGLCDLIEKAATFEPDRLALIDAHVAAIRAVVRDRITSADDATARALLNALGAARAALAASVAPETAPDGAAA